MKKIAQLKTLLNEIADIQSAISLLNWDQQTNMPAGGAEGRSEMLATLSNILHQKSTSQPLGQLLEDLSKDEQTLDPDSDDARLIKICRRNYTKQSRIHPEWVIEFSKATSLSQQAWQDARQSSNFVIFRPHLEKIITLQRQYAGFFAPFNHIYDPLLDDFEPGMKTGEVQEIFDRLRPAQINLIQAIRSRPQVDDSFLIREYDPKLQWDFGVEVISRFGYDWKCGRQDKSVHPFTQGIGPGDVRITTRVEPNRVATALFGTMHEAGHALYEQGFLPVHRRTTLGASASMAIHESQSRLWENLIGRSLPFWKFFYPRFQEVFSTQVGGIDLKTFYRGINKVAPSFIRVEADEATYNLHIMLRMELEIALMEGSLQVKDLPEAWNQKMLDYLGVVPPDDGQGVLQDIHWAWGYIGYFSTYALGNLISAQLWEISRRDISDLERQIERGQFGDLLAWLRKNVHNQGARYEPQELVRKITGSKIDPQPYLRYLQNKYHGVYNL